MFQSSLNNGQHMTPLNYLKDLEKQSFSPNPLVDTFSNAGLSPSSEELKVSGKAKIAFNTNKYELLILPKGGSNMTKRLLALLNFYPDTIPGRPHFYGTGTREINPDKKYIFQVRDPRDAMVSLAYYVDKLADKRLKGKKVSSPCCMSKSDCLNWKKLTFDEKLLTVIKGEMAFGYDFSWAVTKQWKNASRFTKDVLSGRATGILTKFENFVGFKGGESDERQLLEIKKILRFLNTSLSESQIKFAQDNLFGVSATFRKGQTGSWKQHFKEIHVKEFLPRYQCYLEQFDYEKDTNWTKNYNIVT